MRHRAWLVATLEDIKGNYTRYDILEMEGKKHVESKELLNLPPLNHLEQPYMDILNDIGVCTSTGFGVAPLTYTEIHAWSDLSGVKLRPFEARMLHDLSRAYVHQANTSTKSTDESPAMKELQIKRRNRIQNFHFEQWGKAQMKKQVSQ